MTEQMQVPAHIAARIEARKAGTANMSAIAEALSGFASPPRISIRGSKYRLIENGIETVVGAELDVVIVGANPHTSKVFFAGAYDPSADVRPDCSSADGKTPDANIDAPVCASCHQCPNNVLGSKITEQGSKSKLCNDVRYLAVVPAADPSKVYSLNVSVMAMKPLRTYVQELGNYNIMPEEVVTSLGFDDDASYPLVTFSKGNFLPENAIEAIEAVKAWPEVSQAIRTDVQAAALPAPTAEAPASNVAKIEDAKPAKPATAKAKATPKKKAAPKKAAATEAVVADTPEEVGELESALDDIFG